MIAVTAETKGLEAYDKTLKEYLDTRGPRAAEALNQKARQLVLGNQDSRFGAVWDGLFELFRREAPSEGEATNSARARDFAMGRRANAFVKTNEGISMAAWKRAEARMGGHDSILAQVSDRGNRIHLSGVRVGKRGRRIRGGRSGRGGEAVSGRDAALRRSGDKVLNRRAVAVVEEMAGRERGRGFAAIGWLFKTWRRVRINARSSRRTLQSLNKSGKPIGQVEIQSSKDEASILISNSAPGAGDLDRRSGIVARALSSQTKDMLDYLERKEREALQKGGNRVRRSA